MMASNFFKIFNGVPTCVILQLLMTSNGQERVVGVTIHKSNKGPCRRRCCLAVIGKGISSSSTTSSWQKYHVKQFEEFQVLHSVAANACCSLHVWVVFICNVLHDGHVSQIKKATIRHNICATLIRHILLVPTTRLISVSTHASDIM